MLSEQVWNRPNRPVQEFFLIGTNGSNRKQPIPYGTDLDGLNQPISYKILNHKPNFKPLPLLLDQHRGIKSEYFSSTFEYF
jgi:hypothetical protein